LTIKIYSQLYYCQCTLYSLIKELCSHLLPAIYQKWSFYSIAALLGCLKMLTYSVYAPLFRRPRALHSSKNPHFWETPGNKQPPIFHPFYWWR